MRSRRPAKWIRWHEIQAEKQPAFAMAARAALRGQARDAVVCPVSEEGENEMICPNGFTTCCGNSRNCFHPDRSRQHGDGKQMTNRQDDSGALRERLLTEAKRFSARDVITLDWAGRDTAALLTEAANALSTQGSEPAGVGDCVSVPREPTREMVRRGTLAGMLTPNQACTSFQAMLAATPAPAQQAVSEPDGAQGGDAVDGHMDAALLIAAAKSRPAIAPQATPAAVCHWTFDDSDFAQVWNTDCGEAYCFTEGGPEDNGHKFCHGCGKPLVIAAPPAEVKS